MLLGKNQNKFVFSDEKPIKEVDLTSRVRRDPFLWKIPNKTTAANTKNRYTILTAVTTKEYVTPVELVVLEENGAACLFANFVGHFLAMGNLAHGDVFVINNCSIHFLGDCRFLQESL